MNFVFFGLICAIVIVFLSTLVIAIFLNETHKEARITQDLKNLRDYARGYRVKISLNPIWIGLWVVSFAYIVTYIFG